MYLAMLLKLYHTFVSYGDLVKIQAVIQLIWVGAWDCIFNKLPGNAVILDHIRNNKDLREKSKLPAHVLLYLAPAQQSHVIANQFSFSSCGSHIGLHSIPVVCQVAPASGPLHMVFPLHRMPLPGVSTWLAPFLYLDLGSVLGQSISLTLLSNEAPHILGLAITPLFPSLTTLALLWIYFGDIFADLLISCLDFHTHE